MNFSSGSISVIAIGWAVVVLILWNFHRHTRALSRRGLWTGILAATVAATGGAVFLLRQSLQARLENKPLLISPFIEKSANGYRVTPLGLAFAERLLAELRSSQAEEIYPLPLESLFEIANADSLPRPEYLLRVANAVGVEAIGLGVYDRRNNGAEFQAAFQLYARGKVEPILHEDFTAGAEAFTVLSAQILDALGTALRSGAHAAQMQSSQSEYEALWLRFLRREEIADEASVLAARDTSDYRAALLAVRSQLRKLRDQRATEAEWKKTLSRILPLAQRALRQDSTVVGSYLVLAQCYLQQKKWHEAEALLRQALARDQRNSKSYVYLAQLHPSRYAQFGFSEELELYRRALALNPFDLEAVVGAAEYLMMKSRAPEAVALLEQYRRANPNHLGILMSLGRLYINQGNMEKTLALYEQIIQLDSKNANAFYNLGIAYYNHKDFDNAVRFFERAIQLSDHADARLYLAYIYEQRGEIDRSIAYLRERIQLSAGDDDVFAAQARKHLYEILLKRGEIPEHLQPDKLEKN